MDATDTLPRVRFVLPRPTAGDDPALGEAARTLQATDDATVARLYRRAFWLRRQGDLQEAGHLMTALLMMRPQEPAFWTAMGECCAAVHDHERAVQALAYAALLRPGASPGRAGVQAIGSLMALGREDLALSVMPALLAQVQASGDDATGRQLAHLSALLEHHDAT